ncbi:hypothetical protein Q1695_007016 [Nippostrongylus brasiliensis]|nr:hypothetical protein Q1695_007016 [Nippostrongylus brasiliensis]
MLVTTVVSLVALSVVVADANLLELPEGPSNWDDEQEMRARIANYSLAKFSFDYHNWEASSSLRLPPTTPVGGRTSRERKKRDGGLVSGPIATAVVTGMIGMTARTVSELTNFHPSQSEGGCTWFGTAPLCNYPCPSEYDFIRMHNGRCSNMWFSGFCTPDDSFGKPCTTVLGSYFHKRFCCKSDPTDCTWSGRWMGANTAHNIYCRYDNVGKCGSIDCAINHYTLKAQNSSDIYGDRCDRLDLFGLKGKATCGYIAWFNDDGEIVNSWYKTSKTH